MRTLMLFGALAVTVTGQGPLFPRPVSAYADVSWAWPAWSALSARVVVTGTNGPVTFPSGRVIEDVRFGSPTGAATTTGLPAATTPLTLTTGATSFTQWQVPAGTPAGLHWMRIRYTDSAGTAFDEYVCGMVFGAAGGAFLMRTANPTVGGTAVFDISDTTTSAAGAAYEAACSLTSNFGIPFNGDTVCLDFDVLFLASWPNPPGSFTGFSGTLDATGAATMQLQVPNDPTLSGLPFRIQALILDPATGPRLTSPSGYVVP